MTSSILFLNVSPQVEYGAVKSDIPHEKKDKGFERALESSQDSKASARDAAKNDNASVKESRETDKARASDESEDKVVYLTRDDGQIIEISLSQEQLSQVANMDRVSLVDADILEQFGGLSGFMDAIESLYPGQLSLSEQDLAQIASQIEAFNELNLSSETFPQLIAVNLTPAQLSALGDKFGTGDLSNGVFTLVKSGQGALAFDAISADELAALQERMKQFLFNNQDDLPEDLIAGKWFEDMDMAEDVASLRELLSEVISAQPHTYGVNVSSFAKGHNGAGGMSEGLAQLVSGFMASEQAQGLNGNGMNALKLLIGQPVDGQGQLLPSALSAGVQGGLLTADMAPDLQVGYEAKLFTPSVAPATSSGAQSGSHAHGVLGNQQAGQTHQTTQMVATMIGKSFEQGGNQKLSFLLNPPELGRMQINLEMDSANKIKVSMMTEKESAYNLLQRDSSALEQALQDSGLDVGSGDIDLSFAENGFMFDQNNQSDQLGLYERMSGDDGQNLLDETPGEVDVIRASVDIYRDPNIGHWRYNAVI